MADAEDVVRAIKPRPGVAYTGLWLNERGFERALATGRLTVRGSITLGASDAFLKRNQNRTIAEQIASQRALAQRYVELGVPVTRGSVMAAFGCNYEGDVSAAKIVGLVAEILDIADSVGARLDHVSLADTMAWATPRSIKTIIGAVRERWPDLDLALHLHDTRGLGIANAYAGLEMGVARFDAAVAGLGGCPFAGNAGAAGNVCTEDLVFLCDEIGIDTGVDLESLIACARLAEDIVGHPLPGSVMKGGSLRAMRERIAAKG
jgi:hydroxymethylglutaryl-CoA lyase